MLRPRVLLAGMMTTDFQPPPPAPRSVPEVGPWGAPVAAPIDEAHVRRFVEAVAAGRGHEVAGPSLTIGPALWATVGSCADMDGGVLVTHRQRIDGCVVSRPARAFLRDDVGRVLASDALRVVAVHFAAGAVAAASESERRRYHALIPWEIAGQPVVVVRIPDRTLVAEVAEDGSVFHVDLLPA